MGRHQRKDLLRDTWVTLKMMLFLQTLLVIITLLSSMLRLVSSSPPLSLSLFLGMTTNSVTPIVLLIWSNICRRLMDKCCYCVFSTVMDKYSICLKHSLAVYAIKCYFRNNV